MNVRCANEDRLCVSLKVVFCEECLRLLRPVIFNHVLDDILLWFGILPHSQLSVLHNISAYKTYLESLIHKISC